jgi:hypothetical protein
MEEMMKSLQKIKMQLSKLDCNELNEIIKYIYERKDIVSKRNYQKRIQDKIDHITKLPIGTKIVINNNSWPKLTGRIGIIIEHLGRGSERSIIELDDDQRRWRIPRRYLSDNISEENLKVILKQKKDTEILDGILNKINF